MRKRTADVVVRWRFGSGEATYFTFDSQPLESPPHPFPSIRPAVQVNAIDRVKKVKRAGKLGLGGLNHRADSLRAYHLQRIIQNLTAAPEQR